MYNRGDEIDIGSTAATTRSILDSQLRRQTDFMINRNNPSTNSGYQNNSTSLEEFGNNFTDARKQIQMLNNAPVSDAPPQFNMNNAEARRIEQITVSDTTLNQFKRAEANATQMNNVLFSKNHVPEPQRPTEVVEQKYIPEIGQKRRLSNIIYNSLLKKFSNVRKTHINEEQVAVILNKMGLNKETNEWSRKEVKRFSTAIKRLIKHNYNQERKRTRQIVKKTPSEDYFERNTREVTHYVAIDSRDRDRKIWPNSNEFRITFAPSSSAVFDNRDIGFINRDFSNVTSVQLVSVIIPRFSLDGDCIDTYPYLLLEIDELGGIYDGTNTSTSRAFCKITFDTVVGKYVHFSPQNYEPFIKEFNPRISLNRLTIHFKKPNGKLFDFGTSIDYCHAECMAAHINRKGRKRRKDDDTEDGKSIKCHIGSKQNTDELEANVSLTFKVNTIERSLDTMYIHPN